MQSKKDYRMSFLLERLRKDLLLASKRGYFVSSVLEERRGEERGDGVVRGYAVS